MDRRFLTVLGVSLVFALVVSSERVVVSAEPAVSEWNASVSSVLGGADDSFDPPPELAAPQPASRVQTLAAVIAPRAIRRRITKVPSVGGVSRATYPPDPPLHR